MCISFLCGNCSVTPSVSHIAYSELQAVSSIDWILAEGVFKWCLPYSAYEILVNVAISSNLPRQFGQPKLARHCQVSRNKSFPPANEPFKENMACGLFQFAVWRNAQTLLCLMQLRLVGSKINTLQFLTPTSAPCNTLLASAELLKLIKYPAATSSHVGHMDEAARSVAWRAPSLCSIKEKQLPLCLHFSNTTMSWWGGGLEAWHCPWISNSGVVTHRNMPWTC